MSSLTRPPVHPDIVEEHFDELEFLWEHRDSGIFSRDWTLADLANHEDRAEAHLDGLRLSELHGIDLALEKIGSEDTYAAGAATLVLHSAGSQEYLNAILETLETGAPETVGGVRTTLRHLDLSGIRSSLEGLLTHEDAFRAASAAYLLAFSRNPVAGLEPLNDQEADEVRILALGAASRLGELYPKAIATGVEAPNSAVRRAALEAASRLGVSGLIRHCRSAAQREMDPDPEAIYFLGILGDREDLEILGHLLKTPEVATTAVAAMGALGLVDAVPLLLDLMADDTLGVPATAAYKRITSAEHVEGEAPFPPPEVPEGEDESEDLPPDQDRARADWEERKNSMGPGIQWQMGVAIPSDRFPGEEPTLTLEARRDIYLRLKMRMGTAIPDLELEALALKQSTPLSPTS